MVDRAHLAAVARKGQMPLDAHELAQHGAGLDRLEAELQAAHDASALPDEPTATAALDGLVVRLRLARA